MSFKKDLHNEDGKVTLEKFDENLFNFSNQENLDIEVKNLCFLDLETTGLNHDDEIVELAIKLVEINVNNGELIRINDSFESFNDPGFEMDEKNIAVHGISNDMVSGQSIDWDRVKNIFDRSDIVIAHNARFDRSFMDKSFPLSEDKVWACSLNDIDWPGLGFNSRSQELLCIWHGFYYESHRAMADVDALIHLVTHPLYKDQKPIKQLIDSSNLAGYKVIALNSPFEKKDILKANSYFWDSLNKYWWKSIKEEELEDEKSWLENNVYDGDFMGQVEMIMPNDRYK